MNLKKSGYLLPAAAAVCGALMFASSRFFADGDIAGRMLFAFGVAAFILGIGNLLSQFITARVETPESVHAAEIEEKDERNVRVRERAGWAASRIMTTVLCVCALVSAFANAELYVTLVFAGLVVLQAVCMVGFQMYYDKRL